MVQSWAELGEQAEILTWTGASEEAAAGPGTCTGLLVPSRKNTRSVSGGGSTKPLPACCFTEAWTGPGGVVHTAKGAFKEELR